MFYATICSICFSHGSALT